MKAISRIRYALIALSLTLGMKAVYDDDTGVAVACICASILLVAVNIPER